MVLSTFGERIVGIMAGLYIHIPFCKQACHYCDFHFSTRGDQQDQMVDSIAHELDLQKDYVAAQTLSSIYFGGGTPSLLNANQLHRIFTSIHRNFKIGSDCEITLEANPDDITNAKLRELSEEGINRLSIGIQTFNDSILRFLNRAHSGTQAKRSLEAARNEGFSNISIDLIYAIPGQSMELLLTNVNEVLAFQPEHISCYALTIEPKTVFGNWQRKKKLESVDESQNATELELLMQTLSDAGYQHYEVSNFCKPGFYSRHNSSYWKQEIYLGIGPSAHSYNRESRQFNVSNNALYIKSLQQGKIPCEKEKLTLENKVNEFLLTTLRTHWGCDTNLLKAQYGYDVLVEKRNVIERLITLGLISDNKQVLKLTPKGILVADQISLDLML